MNDELALAKVEEYISWCERSEQIQHDIVRGCHLDFHPCYPPVTKRYKSRYRPSITDP